MKKATPVVISDSDNLKNLLIQVDLKGQKTTVLSNFSAWENLALIMEALAVTAQKCTEEGIPKEQVDEEIERYLKESLETYTVR